MDIVMPKGKDDKRPPKTVTSKRKAEKRAAPKKREQPVSDARSSLVARLNSRLLFRLIGIYMGMDLLLAFLFLMGIVFSSYHQFHDISLLVEQRGVPSAEATLWMAAGDYTVAALDREPQGTHLPVTAGEATAVSGGLYTFTKGPNPWLFGFWGGEPGRGCTLTVEVENGGWPYAITLDLSGPISAAVYAGRILLVCQLISLILNLFKNAGTIKKVLHPIQELAAQAAKLNTVSAMTPEELRSLAGQLDEITATHLDARIPVEGAQRELKDLTQSINAMLDRINQAYRAQARFVSDASHELRTPIAVIQGYANLLDRWGKDDPDAMQESITAIRAEAESMKELVEQLLFLARGDNDSMQVEPEVLDLTAVANRVLKEAGMIDEKHLYAAQWDAPVYVNADLGLVKQAMRILVDNAGKYTGAGGHISLKVEQRGEQARVSVTDEGQGIAPEALPHIFDRFYRTDESRARQTGGAGLGLAIARWIAERHGGWFEVVSRKEVGTRVTLVLPAIEPPASESA